MQRDQGYIFAVAMNAHRQHWDGSICQQAESWMCGASMEFRTSFCSSGSPSCFHLHVFDRSAPRFITPETSLVHAVRTQPTLLDGQVLFFYGRPIGKHGQSGSEDEKVVYGAYRIKHGSIDSTRNQHKLVLEPHSDGWTLFPRAPLRAPSLRSVEPIRYLKQGRSEAFRGLVEDALREGERLLQTGNWSAEQHKRLQKFSKGLKQWIEKADDAWSKVKPAADRPSFSLHADVLETQFAAKLRGLPIEVRTERPVVLPVVNAPTPASAVKPDTSELAVPAASPAPSEPETTQVNHSAGVEATQSEFEPAVASVAASSDLVETLSQVGPVDQSIEQTPTWLPEPAAKELLAARFGADLTDALTVGFTTKSLVILTGSPGAGKSWIASRLLDDSSRERTVIVPVASTWRGREDLLGYVNPISGEFEPTELTNFLLGAQDAWVAGDTRLRLVVFEEFNLSQPEHWLSDLLVRLEFDPDQAEDRTVRLGGNCIARSQRSPAQVVLVPSLKFVATVNNDHTVKPLSPRVLDRAALIEVVSSGRAALERAGVNLSPELAEVIDELNDLLSARGAGFSVRSARSLQRLAGAQTGLAFGFERALDFVLAQEVLSRVRLIAGDPRDERLLSRLQEWSQKPACAGLVLCASRIAGWSELVSGGRDVFQA